MKRRSFLKRVGTLIGLSFVNPIALIPDIPAIIPKTVYAGNQFVKPHVIAAGALSLLENELTFA